MEYRLHFFFIIYFLWEDNREDEMWRLFTDDLFFF